MAKVLQISVETHGAHKVVLSSKLKQAEVVTCKLTWFPQQETAHVWLAMPLLYNRHAVTTFQKFKGGFEDLVHAYTTTFQQITWFLVPVVDGSSSLDMVLYKLKGLDPTTRALVRALLSLKKSVDIHTKHGHRGCSPQKRNSGYRVDDGATNPEVAHGSQTAPV
jgi:hypothetical protein